MTDPAEDLTFDGPVTVRPVSFLEKLPVAIDTESDPAEEDGLQLLEVGDFDDEAPTQPGAPIEYRDWRPEDTRVICYTNNVGLYPRDRPAVSAAVARCECEAIHGRILETNTVPHRWFFRVNKVRSTL